MLLISAVSSYICHIRWKISIVSNV